MTTLLLHHPASLLHDTGPGHPERADRIRAIETALAEERFMYLERMAAPEASVSAIARVHPREWAEGLIAASPAEGFARVDGDTIMSPGTIEAALRGAGAAIEAVDAVMTGATTNAFSAMRPPGHHAEKAVAMGFCFFNNAAIAARHAQAAHGAERVAIVDFDVHHGNGTQDIFWADKSVLYASTHEMPLFPGTGALNERGEFDTIVNAPLRAGDGSDEFREAMESVVLPRVAGFRPDLLIISAGFDAHRRDPLANLRLGEEDYDWVTRRLAETVAPSAGTRVVSLLEGGYDLQGLARSVAAHVAVLMEL